MGLVTELHKTAGVTLILNCQFEVILVMLGDLCLLFDWLFSLSRWVMSRVRVLNYLL